MTTLPDLKNRIDEAIYEYDTPNNNIGNCKNLLNAARILSRLIERLPDEIPLHADNNPDARFAKMGANEMRKQIIKLITEDLP